MTEVRHFLDLIDIPAGELRGMKRNEILFDEVQ